MLSKRRKREESQKKKKGYRDEKDGKGDGRKGHRVRYISHPRGKKEVSDDDTTEKDEEKIEALEERVKKAGRTSTTPFRKSKIEKHSLHLTKKRKNPREDKITNTKTSRTSKARSSKKAVVTDQLSREY